MKKKLDFRREIPFKIKVLAVAYLFGFTIFVLAWVITVAMFLTGVL